MHIACPSCAATYDVPDAMLLRARAMRCAACGHDWQTEAIQPAEHHGAESATTGPGDKHEELPADIAPGIAAQAGVPVDGDSAKGGTNDSAAPEPAADAVSADNATDNATDDVADRRYRFLLTLLLHGQRPAMLGWILSLGVLFFAGRAAIAHRLDIVQSWPPSERLFQWLGLG